MKMKEFLKKSLISIAIFLIPAVILVGTGFVLYKLGSQFFSDFKERRETTQKVEELRKNLEEFIQSKEEELMDKEIKIWKETGCRWYKDACPDGFQNTLSPINGEKFKTEGEKLGLIFLKADIGRLSIGSEVILSCCKYYYPQTEIAEDWGTDVCIWEGIPGDCLSESASLDLVCKMEPESTLTNTLIRRCIKNIEKYYWCCPNK